MFIGLHTSVCTNPNYLVAQFPLAVKGLFVILPSKHDSHTGIGSNIKELKIPLVTPRPERCTVHVTIGAYTSTKCHYNSFGSSY